MNRPASTLAADRKWRETVQAALARLRPMRDELKTMLAETESEIGKWEIEERRLEWIERERKPPLRYPGRVNKCSRSRRKPLLIEDKDYRGDDDC